MQDRRNRRGSRLVVRALATAMTAVAMFGSLGAGSAEAFTYSNTGCPGTIQVPRTVGGNVNYSSYLRFEARTTWRSACYSSSTQVVTVRYRVWGYNLSQRQWVFATEATRQVTIAPGYAATMPSWYGAMTYANLSVDMKVEWRTTNGTFIGSTYIDQNHVGDYVCEYGSGCWVGSDPNVGAYIHAI